MRTVHGDTIDTLSFVPILKISSSAITKSVRTFALVGQEEQRCPPIAKSGMRRHIRVADGRQGGDMPHFPVNPDRSPVSIELIQLSSFLFPARARTLTLAFPEQN